MTLETEMTTLSTDQRRFYDDNGYLLIKQFITAGEAASLRAEVHAIAARQGPTNATWSSVSGQGTKLEHSHDVQFRSAACVLDTYLYPAAGGQRVTHIDARLPSGVDTDAQACVRQMERGS